MSVWIVCLSGLPGVGKSSLARVLAEKSGALWLRIDTIEAAMRTSHMAVSDLADGGYAAARAVAQAALEQGFCVVADCVNPIALTRRDWRGPASRAGARHMDVEVMCSDRAEHQRRVEVRHAMVEACPDWAAVEARDYEPFAAAFQVDTANMSAAEAAQVILDELEGRGWR